MFKDRWNMLLVFWRKWKTTANQFVSFIERPKHISSVPIWSETPPNISFAIVMQGPLVEADDFTLETIRLYKKTFPGAKLIVSSWQGEMPILVEALKKEGVIIVENKKPENAGPYNVNMQLTSAHAGMKKAKELGAEYALKTRPDVRIYAPNTLKFLYNLTEVFPVTHSLAQKKRIVSTNTFTLKYRPYSLSDMNVFGHIDDMLKYWGIPLDSRKPFTFKPDATEGEIAKSRFAEVFIESSYLESIGRKLSWTIKDSWQAFADHFCIIDKKAIDIYWHKPEKHKYMEDKFGTYKGIHSSQMFDFREWLNMYASRNNMPDAPEHILEKPSNTVFDK